MASIQNSTCMYRSLLSTLQILHSFNSSGQYETAQYGMLIPRLALSRSQS